jgi:hypothetical protein
LSIDGCRPSSSPDANGASGRSGFFDGSEDLERLPAFPAGDQRPLDAVDDLAELADLQAERVLGRDWQRSLAPRPCPRR